MLQIYLCETCFWTCFWGLFSEKEKMPLSRKTSNVNMLFVFEKKSIKLPIRMFINILGWYTPTSK